MVVDGCGWWWIVVDGGGWLWIVVDGGGGWWWWMVVDCGGWWHSLARPKGKTFSSSLILAFVFDDNYFVKE